MAFTTPVLTAVKGRGGRFATLKDTALGHTRLRATVLSTALGARFPRLRQGWALALGATLLFAFSHRGLAAPGDLDTLDLGITGTGGSGSSVNVIVCQPDGRFIVGGLIPSILTVANGYYNRVNPNGTLDVAYHPYANYVPTAAVLRDNGTLIHADDGGGARLTLLDGSVDFDYAPGLDGVVTCMAMQPDGKTVMGGYFTTVSSVTSRNHIARFNANGTLDLTFSPNTDGPVYSLCVQEDGKILIGGNFSTLQPNGAASPTTRNKIARVNANGTLDTGFDPNADTGPTVQVSAIAVQADGKILIGGNFNTLQPNGPGSATARSKFARLNADGSLDTDYNPSPNNDVASIAVQADGKVLIGGKFTALNPNGAGSVSKAGLVRLDASGTVDTSFASQGTGPVSVVAVQGDGKVMIGGAFQNVGPTARNRWARLLNDPVSQTLATPDATQVTWARGGSAPEASIVNFELSTDSGTTWSPLGMASRVGTTSNWQLTGLSLPVRGQLRGRARSGPSITETVVSFERVVDVNYSSSTDLALVSNGYTATGKSINFSLLFDPTPGTSLMVVKNTGRTFIDGTFSNLTNGAVVTLTHAGHTYPYIAWYYGGDGNDLVLLPQNTGIAGWGGNANGQLGRNTTTTQLRPLSVEMTGALAGKTAVQVVNSHDHSLALCTDGKVYAWGYNGDGELGNNSTTDSHVPVAVNTDNGVSALYNKTVVAISAGSTHSVALCSDGTVATWGFGEDGELGTNALNSSLVPVAVNMANGVSALYQKTVTAIAATDRSNLALCSDGTLVGWGDNSYGTVGDNTEVNRPAPVLVNTANGVSGLSGKTVVGISAGSFHSLAWCSDGSYAGWGYNSNGELGDGTYDSRLAPSLGNMAAGSALLGKTVVAVSGGEEHSAALCSDGTIVTWGRNQYGQLGNNTTTSRNVAVAVNTANGVSALFGKTVAAISAGGRHTAALCSDGTTAICGDAYLGNNSLLGSLVPVAVNTGGVPGWTATGLGIGAKAYHSLAIFAAPSGPEMTVSGNGVEILDADTTPSLADLTDFGGANITGGTVVRTFTILNTGAANLNITGTPKVVIGGTNAADFTVTADPAASVGFTATTSFQITFNPSAAGLRVATVSIANDDGDEGPYNFYIQGTSSDPEITVQQPVGTDVATGATKSFGSVPVGSSSDLTFSIKNTGGLGSQLTGLATTITGTNAAQFSIVQSPAAPLAGPDGTTSCTVRFTAATGAKTAVLRIASNDANENPFNITLNGTGVSNPTAVFANAATPGLSLSTVNATGQTLGLTLSFAPAPGTSLMAVNNTGNAPIQGTYTGLANGSTVNLTFGGKSYSFIAWYYGGDGNDLVLLWPYTGLASWGSGNSGQLGDGTSSSRLAPYPVNQSGVLAGKTIVQVVKGETHSAALCTDGTIAAWGAYALGNNSAGQQRSPVLVNRDQGVSALYGKTVIALAAGRRQTFALCSDGTVAAWGSNGLGELGDNSVIDRLVPVAVNAAQGVSALYGKTVTAISAGYRFAMALCSDGTIAAWGAGSYGQLGNNASAASQVPVAVNTANGISALYGETPVAIAAGGYHALALCADGTLVAWGNNGEGELGDNTGIDSAVPVLVNTDSGVSALFGKRVTAIAAGDYHNLALCSDGSIAGWGYNTYGEVGDGTLDQRNAPVTVNADADSALYGKTVTALSAGYDSSAALLSDGTLAAWGHDNRGQLGDNNAYVSTVIPLPVNTDAGISALAGMKVTSLAPADSSSAHYLAIYASSPGTFIFDDTGYTVTEGGVATLNVLRTSGSSGTATVKVTTSVGTAMAPDFTATTTTLSFADGVTSLPFTVQTATDALPEANESFSVALSLPTGGSVLGTPATATVTIVDPSASGAADTSPPSVTLATPAANALVPVNVGGTTTLIGSAQDNKGVQKVEFRVTTPGALPSSFTVVDHLSAPAAVKTNFTAVIKPVGGLNTVEVKATDYAGNVSTTVTRLFKVSRPLSAVLAGTGTVSTGYAGSSYREVGKSYTITATPGKGQVFNNWLVNDTTGTGITPLMLELPALTFTFVEGLTITAQFIENPFDADLVGAFNGLVLPDGSTTGSVANTGLLNLVVTTKGTFTGSLNMDGSTQSIPGHFDNAGVARFGAGRATKLTLTRAGKPDMEISLQLDMSNATGQITGTVVQKLLSVVQGTSNIVADRAQYSSTQKVWTALTSAPYTLLFPSKTQTPPIGLNTYPQGDGYATMSINANGTVTIAGKLADHTALTASAPLSKDNQWPIYSQLYAGKGCFAAKATVAYVPNGDDVTGSNCVWYRPVQNVQWYKNGWPAGINVDLYGARYIVPPAASAQSVFPALQAGAPNATLEFFDGLLTGPISKNMTINTSNVATNSPTAASPTLTIAKATGLISGAFTHTDTTKPAFQGVIIQKGTFQGGWGYFMSRATPLTYLGESGEVKLSAKPGATP